MWLRERNVWLSRMPGLGRGLRARERRPGLLHWVPVLGKGETFDSIHIWRQSCRIYIFWNNAWTKTQSKFKIHKVNSGKSVYLLSLLSRCYLWLGNLKAHLLSLLRVLNISTRFGLGYLSKRGLVLPRGERRSLWWNIYFAYIRSQVPSPTLGMSPISNPEKTLQVSVGKSGMWWWIGHGKGAQSAHPNASWVVCN